MKELFKPTISYGIVNPRAKCCCCKDSLEYTYATTFKLVNGDYSKKFICGKCFNIMVKCKEHFEGTEE